MRFFSKWKRLITVLSLLLVVSVVGALAIGYYTASAAAVDHLEITFSKSGNWRKYLDPYTGSGAGTLDSDTTIHEGEYVGPRVTFGGENEGNVYFNVTTNDPGIWIDLSAANLQVKANHIVYVRYAVVDETFTATSSKVFFWVSGKLSGSNSLGYSPSNDYRDQYAIIPSDAAGILSKIRIDIPDNPDVTTGTAKVYIQKVFIGDPQDAPVKYTITFKNPDGSNLSTGTYGYNQAVTTPTASYVTSTEGETEEPIQYEFTGYWTTNGSAAGNAELTNTDVDNRETPVTRARGNKTYYAIYYKNYRVRFFDMNGDQFPNSTVWIRNGKELDESGVTALPTVPNITSSDGKTQYRHKSATEQCWQRYESSNGKTSNLTAAVVLGTDATNQVHIQGGYVDFTALYHTYFRVRFYGGKITAATIEAPNNEGAYDVNKRLAMEYVKSGSKINTVFANTDTLPDASNLYFFRRADSGYDSESDGGCNGRYYFTSKWHVGSKTSTTVLTESKLLNETISAATDYHANYRKDFIVWFNDVNGSPIIAAWTPSGSTVSSNDVPNAEQIGTISGKTFVAWVSTGAGKVKTYNGNPTADDVGAIEPTAYTVTGPMFLYPRFLDNTFIGASKDGLVATRTIKELDAANYKYQVQVEVYNYGAELDGYIDIFDSYTGNFTIKGPRIFYQAYLGNGKFDETALSYNYVPTVNGTATKNEWLNPVSYTSNAGKFGYVYNKLTNATIPQNGMHTTNKFAAYRWIQARMFDPNFATYANATDYNNGVKNQKAGGNATLARAAAFCREVPNTATDDAAVAYPNGFKIVLIYEINFNEDATMGGNNFDMSHKDYMKVVYTKSDGTKQIIDFHETKTTCIPKDTTKETQKVAEPNLNLEVQYDFVVHDYYMDLLDYKNTQAGFDEKYERVRGLLTVLQSSNKDNNTAVYGRMFSHGNVNVYKDTKFNPDNLDVPNTDINGIRNARVNIFYTVKHETAGLVYETATYGNEDVTKAENIPSVSNAHNEIKVDFTKDHKVTVTAKVVPITFDTDSFGRDPFTTGWEHSADAYFFAPRFIVADFGRTSAVDLQREGCYKPPTFVETPSYILRETHKLGGTTSIKLFTSDNKEVTLESEYNDLATGIGATIRSRPTAVTTAMYGFNNTQGVSDSVSPSTHKFLEGVHKFTYKTDVINHLKYSEDTEITRNVYVIPATNILYHELFMDFTKGTKDDSTNADTATWIGHGKKMNYVIYDNTDDYGYNKVITSVVTADYKDYGEYSKYAQPNSTTRNIYGNFTFTGTGFEILSRTGDTGVLVVEVYNKGTTTLVKRFLVDTYLEGKTLYQVPVVQCTDLTYGAYDVQFRAYYHEIFDHKRNYKSASLTLTEQDIREALGIGPDEPLEYTLSASGYRGSLATRGTGSYDVYVDGVRIYNPLGTPTKPTYENGGIYEATAQQLAYALYGLHGELNPTFTNLNDVIIDAKAVDQWTSEWNDEWKNGGVDGALYLAYNGKTFDDSSKPYEGILIGMNGKILVDDNGYLLDSTGAFLMSKCHNKKISRSWEEHPINKKERWVYYCNCTEKHALSRQQILDNKITFYSSSYEALGPEHEIYLSQGHGLAFAVDATAVHIGLRSPDGSAVKVQAYDPDTGVLVDISSLSNLTCKTEMYYDFTDYITSDGFVILKNNGSGILAIDTIKTIGGASEKHITVNYELAALANDLFTEDLELPVDETVQMANTLALENDITVMYIAKAEQLAQYDSFYMEVTIPVYEGNELVDEKIVRIDPVADGEYYNFYLEGIGAKQMNDTLLVHIYMTKDGETYVSRTFEYSIANYAYNMLIKEDASDALKTVCANLLRYGGEAQKYFGYRTDALVDEELAEEQKVYLIDTDSLVLNSYRAMCNDLENPKASMKSATLLLSSNVIVHYTLNLANYDGNVEDLTVRISYVNADGDTVSTDLSISEVVDEANGLYAVEFDGLVAKQMRTIVTAAIYEGETQISRSVEYSIESYAADAQEEVSALCKAMIAYGDAASAFFAN